MTNWTRILRRATGAAALTAALGAAPAGAAAPGVPDPDFGVGGVTQQDFAGDAAQAVRVLPTGAGLVVVGDTATTTSRQGRVIVSGFGPTGVLDGTFGSTFGWDTAGPSVGDALRETGGRLVIAQNGTPGDAFPQRIRLTGTGVTGGIDPVFGPGGHTTLSLPGRAVRLLSADDGTLLVAGETTSATGSLTTGALLARVSPDGPELSFRAIPLSSDASVGAAVRLADGSVLIVGSDPALFLARFRADGEPDATFGTGGVLHLAVPKIQVDDATLDGSGRLLVAGAHIGDFGRSVDVPIRPLLLRLSTSGVLDASLARVGRSTGYVDELTSVRTLAGKIYASGDDGRVLRFSAAGRPDLRFGVGGTSVRPATRFFDATDLTFAGDGALLAGDTLAPTGFDNRLALERVRLAGRALVRPRRRARVQVGHLSGHTTVRVPVSPFDQVLSGRVTVPLLARRVSGGDGFFFSPPGAVAGAAHGTVRIVGVGGAAVVRHGRVTLRRAAARIAELTLAPPRCGAVRSTRFRLRGGFVIRAGRLLIRNRSHRARVLVRRRCGTRTRVIVLSGRVTVVR